MNKYEALSILSVVAKSNKVEYNNDTYIYIVELVVIT